MSNQAGNHKRRALWTERRALAMEYRKAGLTYRDIGERMGISGTAARKLVRTELEKLAQQTLDDARLVRELELQRLDTLTAAIWERAVEGNLRAVDRVVTLMRRRAQLLGLDAPVRTEEVGLQQPAEMLQIVIGGERLKALEAVSAADPKEFETRLPPRMEIPR